MVLIGHTQRFLRPSTKRHANLGSSTDAQSKKRKVAQDIAALEQQLKSLSFSVTENNSEPELCSLTIGTVQSSSKRTTMGMDSGAEVTVWPLEVFSEVATVESEESRPGMKYFGPRDNFEPTLPNVAKRQCSLKVVHPLRKANVNIAPVRKPLLPCVR